MGRKAAFDRQTALKQIMVYVWRNGYSNSSMRDVAGAVAIQPQSLYNTFGNKEALYVDAVGAYVDLFQQRMKTLIDDAHRTHKSNRALLVDLLVMDWDDDTIPKGCLVVDTLGELPEISTQLQAQVDRLFTSFTETVSEILAVEQNNQRIRSGISINDLSQLLLNSHNGIQSAVKDAKYPADVAQLADTTMKLIYQP